MKKYLVMVFFIISYAHAQFNGQTFSFCSDESEWPPYNFFKTKSKVQVSGYDVDVMNKVANENKFKVEYKLIPWKRCLKMVKRDLIQGVISISHSEERAKSFYFSKPYYFLTPHYYFSKNKYPNGLNLKNLNEVSSICGMTGYNYGPFGIPNKKVARLSSSFESLTKRLLKGKCDIALGRKEILLNYKKRTGKDLFFNNTILSAPVPNVKKTPFFVAFSKTKRGKKLKINFDKTIEKMKEAGQLSTLLKKYLK